MSKEAQARYKRTEKGKATEQRYDKSLKGKIRHNLTKARKRLEV